VFGVGRGTRITATVSEAGTLRFTVQRRRAGRKARYRTRGSFTRNAKAGTNRVRFSGRLKGRRLAPGRYRLRAVAVDAAGNRSKAKFVTFRVVRR
jgi:homogentisate 1,2-dioxygenase